MAGFAPGLVLVQREIPGSTDGLASGAVSGRQRRSYGGAPLRAHDEAEAERLVQAGLERLGCREEEMCAMKKSDPRKQAIVWLVKTQTVVDENWLARRLSMGHPSNVSRALAAYREGGDDERMNLRESLHACRD